MEITLEKIELVKDRTGVSYKEAKEALENAGGSVVDAIIAIEETINGKGGKSMGGTGGAVVEKLKELIKKGNVSKILVKKDGEVVLNLPVNVGILGTVLAPIPIVLGTLAALGTKCEIEVIKDDGTILDVSEMAMETFEDVKEKGGEIFVDVKKRGGEVYREVREKASDALDKVNTKMDIDLSDEEDFFDDMEEEVKEAKDKVVDKVDDLVKDAKDTFDDVLDELNKEK